jgi:hypothetical protein
LPTKLAWILPWILFGIPLAAVVFLWVRLWSNWKRDVSVWSLIPMLLTTSSIALACGSLAYAQFVRPFPPHDYTIEKVGLLLSVAAILTGFLWLRGERGFNSVLASAISGWMFILWLLMVSSY